MRGAQFEEQADEGGAAREAWEHAEPTDLEGVDTGPGHRRVGEVKEEEPGIPAAWVEFEHRKGVVRGAARRR